MSKQKRPPPQESVIAGHGGLIPYSEITDNDVLSGRGKRSYESKGSIKFRDEVAKLLPNYLTSKDEDKRHLAAELIAKIRSADPPGRFLKPTSDGMYKEIGDKSAWEKAMMALRRIGPAVRKELEGTEQSSLLNDDSRKRGQADIAGAVEEQPSRQLSIADIAERCLEVMAQKKSESSTSDADAGAATATTATGAADADAGQGKRRQVPWGQRYKELLEFKQKCGHTEVPQIYPPNPSLGRWVQKQRCECKKRMDGKKSFLNDKKLRLLQSIEFIWKKGELSWESHYDELVHYKDRNGNCHVPINYKRNTALGRWVRRQRDEYKKMLAGDAGAAVYMNDSRIKKLKRIGFCLAPLANKYAPTHDITNMPEVMEGFIRPEQNGQGLAGSKRWMQNAQTLFATVEEVREKGRSILASDDNSPPTLCGLGGLNNDTLGNIIGFLQSEDWKQTMSLVCTGWRRAVLRLDSCSINDLSSADLLRVFGFLDLSDVVKATQTCHKFDDLLSLALLRRPELLPCVKDPQWIPVFDLAAEVLENSNSPTAPLVSECAPKYHHFLQCEKCKRKIAHPPPQPGGARQKYMHVCCSDSERGVNEILKIADCVSKSGSLNHNGRMSLLNKTIDELICLSSIPTDYKNGRYFKTDATSPECKIDGILSDFFEKIIFQGEAFKALCEETYPILGRRQPVLLSLLIAFVIYVGPGKVGTTGTGQFENDRLIALPRTHQSGASSYSNDLYIREAVFAAMKFNDRRPSRAAEGFLIAAGSLLGAVVNKKLERPGNSIPETTMVYFAGLRTDSLWEHCLIHSRLHHDFGRRMLLSDDDEGVEPSSSSKQQQSVPALSDDERREFEQRLEEKHRVVAEEQHRRHEVERRLEEQQRLLADEQQRRSESERRLEDQERAMADDEQRRSESRELARADFLAFQAKWMDS